MKKSFFKIGLIYFISLALLAIVFCCGYWGIVENDILSSVLIQIVVMFAIPMLLYTLMIGKNPKQTIKDTGFKKISKKMLTISILLGIVLYILNQFVANTFAGIIALLGYESIGSSAPVTIDYEFLLKELILACILPAICEEFLHRGILLHANKKTGNPRFCLIISSILFGLTHLNINQFFYAAILGYFMGYVCLVSDSIIPAIVIHFMNNFLGSFIYYGAVMGLPVSTFFYSIKSLIFSNFIILFFSILIGIPLLILIYKSLVKKMLIEKTKRDMNQVVNEIGQNISSPEQAQEKINTINTILKQSEGAKSIIGQHKNIHFTFKEKLFYISSIILGCLITISSFIWGIL